MTKINTHFSQEHPEPGDSDFDEELHGKFEKDETKSLMHSKPTVDTENTGNVLLEDEVPIAGDD